MKRPAWSTFRAALDARGFRPSRRLGQNFLRDGNMARAIARDAGVVAGDFVLEVGPGCGFLTVHLAELGAHVLAVEIDPRLADVARSFLGAAPDVELLVADALAGKHRLEPELTRRLPSTGPWHLVANLPYSAGTPIVVLLSRLANPPESMTVLVQRELADRLAARPGTREWGALSARIQLVYGVEAGRTVGADLFWPRPKVASRVVRLERRQGEPRRLEEVDRVLELLFRERRKTVGRVLTARLGSRRAAEELLAGAGVSPEARPEVLSLEELSALGAGWPRA